MKKKNKYRTTIWVARPTEEGFKLLRWLTPYEKLAVLLTAARQKAEKAAQKEQKQEES